MDGSAPESGHSPFSSSSGPAAWRNYVSPFSEPGLSTCITDGLLRLDGVRVAATWVDVVAMRLVEWAIRKNSNIILISPDPYDLLVPLTAAAVHVSRMAELKKQYGGYPRSDRRVAVVTSRFSLRTAYRRLGVLNAKLFDAVPAATKLPTGDIAVLGGDAAHPDWSTLFVDRPGALRGVGKLSLIVVDLPVYDWQALNDIAVPKVIVGHDPTDPLVHRLEATTPLFAWCPEDLRGLTAVRVVDGGALTSVAARLEKIASGSSCAVVPVRSQRVSESAAWFWSDVGLLHRAARESFLAGTLAKEAHGLFQDLMHLAVPTSFYEDHAGRTFRARLLDLNHDEFKARGDLRELYLPTVHAELSDLVTAVGSRSPKVDALIDLLRQRVGRRQSVALVARTAALARTFRAYLTAFPELDRVRVTSLTEVSEEPPVDVAVITGLAPAWGRHIYRSGIATEILVLAYAIEEPLIVGDPFVEADYIARAISYQKAYSDWLARPALKAKCWKALSNLDLQVQDDAPTRPRIAKAALESAIDAPPDVPPGLWDERASSRPGAEGVEDPPPPSFQDSAAGDVDAVRITFDDGRWVFLDRDGSVTRFARETQRPEAGTEVHLLRPGDEVVFLDGDSRKDILAKVLEVAKEMPHLATAATWVEYWRGGLRRAKQHFVTYNALGDALRNRGCFVQTQTIRLWVVGVTIGPSDPLDVRRVGEVIGDAALRDHHSAVYRGIEAFRDSHKYLTQRVGSLAMHVGPAASAGTLRADEVIDAKSGLTAADFRDSVEILTIRSIEPVGRIPLSSTGRLHNS